VKLSIRSIGGFAGPVGAVTRTIDLDALPDEARRIANKLVAAAHLFDRPAAMLLKAPKSWDFRHLVTIEDGARSHSIELHLDAVDAPLRALVEWLDAQAR
jgi:hypothetical protein